MKIALIIPVYNEGKSIGGILNSIPSEIAGNPVMTVVVDDGSRDTTAYNAQGLPGVYLVRHRSHLGRGAAAKTGCDVAFTLGADMFVLMSAHGTYSAKDIELLVNPLLLESSPQMVLGRQKHTCSLSTSSRISNFVVSMLAKVLFGITIHDTESGFRAFPRSLYPDIRWGASSSVMETEMLILAAQQKAQLVEVAISSHDDVPVVPFNLEDSLYIFQTLVKLRLTTLREYQPLESPLS